MAVAAARRRTDRDEHRIGFGHRGGEIDREGQPAGGEVGGDESVEPGLVDRHDAGTKRIDLGLVLVDSDDLMPEA
jgi:hypothetical protein